MLRPSKGIIKRMDNASPDAPHLSLNSRASLVVSRKATMIDAPQPRRHVTIVDAMRGGPTKKADAAVATFFLTMRIHFRGPSLLRIPAAATR